MSTAKIKSVCIIGAGPAGLVTAKTFLQTGSYSVTVFEAADRVGGMWRAMPGEHGDKCDPQMNTNLSRFTVAFSDLSWSAVNLDGGKGDIRPMFPKAWHVGQYLHTYAKKFNLLANIVCKRRVTSIKASEDFQQWEVTCLDDITRQTSTDTFDYLVVASGFFNQPGRSIGPTTKGKLNNIQHSSQFRALDALTDKAGKIVVIGGGISGSEAAAQAAMQISDTKFTPNLSNRTHSKSKVYHISNRPFYCLPRYIPDVTNKADQGPYKGPRFLPLDLVLYNIARRGGGEIVAAIDITPEDKAKKGHAFVRSVIGSDQSHVERPGLDYNPEQTKFPAYTGITDTYSEFVRSGIIVPVCGWVEKVDVDDDEACFSVTVKPKAPWVDPLDNETIGNGAITGVTGIIEATGYKTSLDFFDDRIKSLLEYDTSCPRIPILLSRGSIFSTRIPTLGFVGFYEGPFWSFMEMQARFIVQTWSSGIGYPSEHNEAAKMRHALLEAPLNVPQFWMNDYLGLVEEFARKTGISRNDTTLGVGKGPAFAARYADDTGDAAEVNRDVTGIIEAPAQDPQFVAAAVFRGLQGVWSLERKVEHHPTHSLGGHFISTAHFHPRKPTCPHYSAEYIYVEENTIETESGTALRSLHHYIYRYKERDSEISVWLVKGDMDVAGELIMKWRFIKEPKYTSRYNSRWVADGRLQSCEDLRLVDCELNFNAATLTDFSMKSLVEGPNTNYEDHTSYRRPEAEHK